MALEAFQELIGKERVTLSEGILLVVTTIQKTEVSGGLMIEQSKNTPIINEALVLASGSPDICKAGDRVLINEVVIVGADVGVIYNTKQIKYPKDQEKTFGIISVNDIIGVFKANKPKKVK